MFDIDWGRIYVYAGKPMSKPVSIDVDKKLQHWFIATGERKEIILTVRLWRAFELQVTYPLVLTDKAHKYYVYTYLPF